MKKKYWIIVLLLVMTMPMQVLAGSKSKRAQVLAEKKNISRQTFQS